MKHRRTRRFQRAFRDLAPEVKEQARKAFRLFAEDRFHPSLGIERVQGYAGVWAGRVNESCRWTFHYVIDEDTGETICVYRMIGGHEIYRNP